MSNLVSFSFDTLPVRTVEDGNQVWFVARDVANVLEYKSDNTITIFAAVPQEWTTRRPIAGSTGNGGEVVREMLCISEPGLYFFLGRSDKPKALPFQKWVAGKVIPSIRKTGKYETNPSGNDSILQLMSRAQFLLGAVGIKGNQMALALDKLHKNKTGESLLALTGIELVRPQQCHLATPTEIGQRLAAARGVEQISGIAVNQMLAAKGYQERVNKKWVATEAGIKAGATYLDVGKARSNGTPVTQMKWPIDILD